MVTNNSCDYSPTQYNVQTGGASGTLNNVAPSATSGVPVISQGASSQPAFGTAVVAGGGTGDTSFTAYAPIIGGTTTTGALQSAGSGQSTSGFVWTSTGASSAPTFQAAATGALVLLQTQTASNSAALTFTSLISGTYSNYLLMWSGVALASAAILVMQISTNNGVSYITTSYQAGNNVFTYNSASTANSNSTSSILLSNGMGQTTDYGTSGFVYFTPSGTNIGAFSLYGSSISVSNQTPQNCTIVAYNSNTATNAFQVLASSGNISVGKFSLYGLAS